MKKQEFKFILGNGSKNEIRADGLSFFDSMTLSDTLRMRNRIIENGGIIKKVKEKPVKPEAPPAQPVQTPPEATVAVESEPITPPADEDAKVAATAEPAKTEDVVAQEPAQEKPGPTSEQIARFENLLMKGRELDEQIKTLEEKIQRDLEKEGDEVVTLPEETKSETSEEPAIIARGEPENITQPVELSTELPENYGSENQPDTIEKPTLEENNLSELEIKKADIEKRRQEELKTNLRYSELFELGEYSINANGLKKLRKEYFNSLLKFEVSHYKGIADKEKNLVQKEHYEKVVTDTQEALKFIDMVNAKYDKEILELENNITPEKVTPENKNTEIETPKNAEEYRKALIENSDFFAQEDKRHSGKLKGDEFVKFKNISKEEAIEEMVKAFDKVENKIESKEVKFFSNKYNKTLEGELPNSSGAKFKILNIKGDQAEFEYCGLPININWFEEIASFTNDPYLIENIKEIITVKPGIVSKNSEGKWEVKTPAQIKFIG